jgi:hypothetical protein
LYSLTLALSSTAEAHIRSGEEWETVIVNQHLRQKGHVVFSSDSQPPVRGLTNGGESETRLSQQKIPYDKFIDILKNYTPPKDKSQNTRFFIYQPTLIVPIEFYQQFGIQCEDIKFSTCYPDLVEIVFSEDCEKGKRTFESFLNSFYQKSETR